MNQLEVLKEKIAGLKFAKEYIKGSDLGVCAGLTSAFQSDILSHTSMMQIKRYIDKALDGYSWLNNWIKNECGLFFSPSSGSEKMQNTRQAWIDWMIQCYQEDLDKLQSPELTMFYNEIQAWIDNGCPKHEVFNKQDGLCRLVDVWTDKNGYTRLTVYAELKEQFEKAYLSRTFPFGGSETFFTEQDNKTLYKNTNRLNWIKAHC